LNACIHRETTDLPRWKKKIHHSPGKGCSRKSPACNSSVEVLSMKIQFTSVDIATGLQTSSCLRCNSEVERPPVCTWHWLVTSHTTCKRQALVHKRPPVTFTCHMRATEFDIARWSLTTLGRRARSRLACQLMSPEKSDHRLHVVSEAIRASALVAEV
jgi:hypothetical protein